MATIPLPALDVKPPAPQQNPMEQYANLLQLKNAVQNAPLQNQLLQNQVQGAQLGVQQQQMQIASNQALMDAGKGVDPSDPNYFQKVFRNAQSSGKVLPQQLAQYSNNVLDHQIKLAQLPQEQLKAQQALGDSLYSMGSSYLKLPDDQMAAQWPTMRQKIMSLENINPQMAAQQLPEQFPGRDVVQQLTTQVGMSSAMMRAAAAQKQAQYKVVDGTLMDVSGDQPVPAMQGQMDPTQWSQAVDSVVPPKGPYTSLNSRTHAQVDFYLKQGNMAGAQKAITDAAQQIGSVEKETNPLVQQGKINVAAAEGAARANIEAQIARGSNAALANVPPHLVAPATSAATKAGEEYAQAQSVTQRLGEMMDAAKRGNVVSYQLLPQEGALQVTTSQGVHRINMAEIQNYGGGSLWQKLQGDFGKAVSGKSIPPSVLDDMAEMQAVQQRGAQAKYNNALKTINQTYGANFQPVQMDSTAPKAQPSGNGGGSGLGVRLADAMALPQNRGKSRDQVIQDIQAHGHTVIQ